MNKLLSTIVNSDATVPALVGISGVLLGVSAGVLLERTLQEKRKSEPQPLETNTHPRLFDPDDPPREDEGRVVITLDDALRLREEARLEGATEAAEDYEPPVYIPDVLAEKVASGVTPPTPQDPRGEEPVDPAPVPFCVLDAADEAWDWARETNYRELHPEGPYSIHEEEFASMDAGYHIEMLLFYEGDEVMCSENDPMDVMYNHALKVGDLRFGYGTTDKDVCYVRNPGERTDYKITRMYDLFSVAVMGIEEESAAERDELAHMDRPLRMRRLE